MRSAAALHVSEQDLSYNPNKTVEEEALCEGKKKKKKRADPALETGDAKKQKKKSLKEVQPGKEADADPEVAGILKKQRKKGGGIAPKDQVAEKPRKEPQ